MGWKLISLWSNNESQHPFLWRFFLLSIPFLICAELILLVIKNFLVVYLWNIVFCWIRNQTIWIQILFTPVFTLTEAVLFNFLFFSFVKAVITRFEANLMGRQRVTHPDRVLQVLTWEREKIKKEICLARLLEVYDSISSRN